MSYENKMIKNLIVFLSAITLCYSTYHDFDKYMLGDWNYHNFKGWGAVSTICTAGQNQSPIDLRANVEKPTRRIPIQFSNYNSLLQPVNIRNNGHTVELNGRSLDNQPSITGSVLSNQIYTFSSAHIHWSTHNNNGTEHSFNGEKYAAELHLVHFNSKYQNITEASNHPDGLAVVGILYSVKKVALPNRGMVQYSLLANTVRPPNSSSTSTAFDLSPFLSFPVRSIYSYRGSLTTPPCSENVRWIVVAYPLPINSAIIASFRSVTLKNNDNQNIRPLQSGNNRPVEFYSN